MNNDTFAILEQRTDKHGRAAWFLGDMTEDGCVVLHVSRDSAKARIHALEHRRFFLTDDNKPPLYRVVNTNSSYYLRARSNTLDWLTARERV